MLPETLLPVKQPVSSPRGFKHPNPRRLVYHVQFAVKSRDEPGASTVDQRAGNHEKAPAHGVSQVRQTRGFMLDWRLCKGKFTCLIPSDAAALRPRMMVEQDP